MWQIATGQEYRAALTITNAQSPDAADKCHSRLGWGRGLSTRRGSPLQWAGTARRRL